MGSADWWKGGIGRSGRTRARPLGEVGGIDHCEDVVLEDSNLLGTQYGMVKASRIQRRGQRLGLPHRQSWRRLPACIHSSILPFFLSFTKQSHISTSQTSPLYSAARILVA